MAGFYKIRLKPSFIIFIKINTSLLVWAPIGPLKGELPVSLKNIKCSYLLKLNVFICLKGVIKGNHYLVNFLLSVTAISSHLLLNSLSACPFTLLNVTSCVFVRPYNSCHNSLFFTGSPPAVFQPFFIQP